jgi:hypothetical protein
MSKPAARRINHLLLFSVVACTIGSLSLALDALLAKKGIPRAVVAIWPHLVVGVAAGTLCVQIVALVQERREVMQDRLCKVADMNHHVRNALAVVAFYGTQGSPAGAELVSEAVKRIEWALREVLPKGWNVTTPVRADQQTNILLARLILRNRQKVDKDTVPSGESR